MNARKKAKKYKRMYEELVKQPQPIRYKIERSKIDTLRFERLYPGPEAIIFMENSNYLREVIAKDIALSLASSLDKYIDYHTEFCPHINQYRIWGEIKVVDRSCEKE